MAETITPELEAVARAIHDSTYGADGRYTYNSMKEFTPDHARITACRNAARAALSAIREPTQEMLDATDVGFRELDEFRDNWRSIIDHILGSDING